MNGNDAKVKIKQIEPTIMITLTDPTQPPTPSNIRVQYNGLTGWPACVYILALAQMVASSRMIELQQKDDRPMIQIPGMSMRGLKV